MIVMAWLTEMITAPNRRMRTRLMRTVVLSEMRVKKLSQSVESMTASGATKSATVCADAPPECRVDDCGAARVCNAGSCEDAPPECRVDADCGAARVCNAGSCEDAPPECRVDADCRGDRVCNAGSCEDAPPECRVDADAAVTGYNAARVKTHRLSAGSCGCGAGRVCNAGRVKTHRLSAGSCGLRR